MHIPFNKPHVSGKELWYIAQAHARGQMAGDGFFTKQCQRWLEEQAEDPHRDGAQDEEPGQARLPLGLRGPGETQLETDRRLLRKRVRDLKRQLDEIEERKRRQVLTRADEFDRHARHVLDRQQGTTARVAVKLGQDHPADLQGGVELTGRAHGVLSGQRD